MRVLLLEKNRLIKTNLPNKIEGNYWIVNENKKNLVNIEAIDGKWVIKGNREIKISLNYDLEENTNYINEIELSPNSMYFLVDNNNDITYKLYCENIYDDDFLQYKFSFDTLDKIILGNDSKTSLQASEEVDIKCNILSFAKNQIKITYDNSQFYITNLNPRINMYINNYISEKETLLNGDIVFIDGLKFGFFGEFLLINNSNKVSLDPLKYYLRDLPTMQDYDFSNNIEEYMEVFKKEDYFSRPPRINKAIEPKEIKVDPVPGNQNNDQMPLIFTMGTMLTMGATSMMTGITAITKITSGEATVKDQMGSLITCGTMVVGMICFPLIRNLWMRKRKEKKERLRKKRYREYLKTKKEEITNEIDYQRQVLLENNLSPEDCAKVIINNERNLWERKLEHHDFLNVRIGLGTRKPEILIKAPEEHFVIEKDVLVEEMHEVLKELKDMEQVPIVIDLKEKLCASLIGEYKDVSKVIDNIVLELMTNQSYDNLKIVVLTNEKNKHIWKKYQNLPYFWNNEKTIRFLGTNLDEIMQISNYLTENYNARLETFQTEKEITYRNFKPYYLIITDSIESLENVSIIQNILNNKLNLGFSLLINTNNIDSLPNECSLFINLEKDNCAVYEQELIANKQISFIPDKNINNLHECLIKLSNIPVDIADGKFLLPPSYGFLEMYDVGNVNQLNSINRWKENDIINSLQAPIGINEQGELFKLDIHEKYHGPHGLVAGMTGSGKSEWLITYILSMAINYHPDEVQFVLIDYKGGGLAGVFENRETGFKLPHLAGTITNLDVVEINRALASIQSELKRRQAMFNTAREALNESTIDIYKYQRFYREGKVKEPMSHLIIISDEFAELKSQQPEFMSELISTARIGRSLGVHLILATQKPSGVVDDQIWSNAKFRACLKVQEKADSNDMIKRPDAAMIKEPGRFFLQVGFNEYFAKGQGAYAGGPYYESDKRKAIVDTSLEFVSNLGYRYKTIETKRNIIEAVHKGEELPNVLKYIKDTADKTETHVKQLWLERIPNIIFHDNLKIKYAHQKQNFVLNPIIGEYDAPEIQKQGILTLPLTKEGNTVIYGISGSGKENLLLTIMYSLITNYTVKELNAYILDFGAEILTAYKNAPQVGEILRNGDDEKIVNLFKMLKNTLEQRKELFSDYNGDIYTYSTTSGKTVPNLVVIINNVENFQELYPNYQEDLIMLTRDGFKYGIIFICTTNGTNNIRLKLAQNFPQILTLQLKDKYDYTGVLGNTNGVMPSKAKGRGLVKLNKVYEFQSAYVVEEAKQIEFIKNICNKLKDSTTERAIKVPILPKVVNYDFIDDSISNATQVPIGVLKESLEIAKFDFLSKDGTLIISQDGDLLSPFATSLLYVLSKINNLNVFVIDANKLLTSIPQNVKYYNNNFDVLISELSKIDINKTDYKDSLFIISGINSLIENLSPENKLLLPNLFNKINKISKFNYILLEQTNDIKKIEYESWYKDTINNTRGIYLGNGIDNQMTIKLSKITRDLREEIPEDFGYAVVKGKAFLIKLINIKEGEINE